MKFDELQAILSQTGTTTSEELPGNDIDASENPSSETASPQGDLSHTVVDQSGSPDEGTDHGSAQPDETTPMLTPRLIQGAKAVRLAIAGHQDLVARAVRAKIELDDWEDFVEVAAR